MNKIILIAVSMFGIANGFVMNNQPSFVAGLLGLALAAYSLRKQTEPERLRRRLSAR